jgi:hypothetical protein
MSNEKEWQYCWKCGGEGFSHHDCGEDCCCCANPEPNVKCDICNGEGGRLVDPIEEYQGRIDAEKMRERDNE